MIFKPLSPIGKYLGGVFFNGRSSMPITKKISRIEFPRQRIFEEMNFGGVELAVLKYFSKAEKISNQNLLIC